MSGAALAAIGRLSKFRTPDTKGYLALGYTAIFVVLGGYLLYVWVVSRRGKPPSHDD